ncbi:MAG: hypothetical protein COS34_00375 [Lysobacterales bacterium CG02_land_8_20_14_3_00_62_12]|nr:MAG: hypothetical protein COS34_00375 [Xanthomonadales bacterium CG02_land_8_20_14_3_00_62_12]
MAERPLLASLLTQVDGDEDRVVAYADSGPVTLPSFRHQVQCWQAALVATPGSRVALYHEDSLTFAAALFGAWHAGKQVLLPADALPNSLERAAGQVDCFIGDLPGAVPINFQAAPAALRRLSALDPKLTSLVLFTSGSSGEPVAISKALPQLQSELSALELCFGERLSETVIFGSVSHQHLYGLLFRILWPLAYRRPFYARRLCTPEQIAALPGTAPAVLVASPAQLKRLPKSLDWQAVRSRMRVVFSSGGPLPAAANDAVEQLWRCPPIEIFGSTETGGIASRQGADNPWSALPGVQWRIVDELLAVRSAHLPNAEWQSTTDRAEAVGAGFQLRGRSDRIAKIEETRVSLSAIEQALLASGLVEAAKVTVLNEQRAMIAAVAVPTAAGLAALSAIGKRLFCQRLRATLADRIDPIALPRRWRFVDTLPIDAQAKTTEAMLAALFKPRLPAIHWLVRDADSAALEFSVCAELACFDGHFPALPVLPGVALIDWTIHWGGEVFALPGHFVRIEALKFQRLVRPGAQLHLQMSWKAATATLGFCYTSTLGTHASGRLWFAAAAQ